jgi:hypothetical protein
MAGRQRHKLFRAPVEESAATNQDRTHVLLRKNCERLFEIAIGSGIGNNELQAQGACRRGFAGSARTPNREALGINSRTNCNCFGANSNLKLAMPVTFAPGRLRLATSPDATGSLGVAKTIGMVLVAAFTTSAAVRPSTTITATRRRRRSSASVGSRSN